MTPQIIAEAMSKDDPHYTPADVNPFASISRFKYGRKVLEHPRSRKSSGNSGGLITHKPCDRMSASFSGAFPDVDNHCQSLPSSPLSMRRAAEKLHQASLHGSEWARAQSRQELSFSFDIGNCDQAKSDDGETVSDKRAAFGGNRTRSLGDLDYFNPTLTSRQQKEIE